MRVAGTALRLAVWVYQVALSPLIPPSCRYWPTCSVYAAQAVRRHGALAGSRLALRRILRCHPWGGWGHDPVPADWPGGQIGCGHITCEEGGQERRS